jgi:hypothetical protein
MKTVNDITTNIKKWFKDNHPHFILMCGTAPRKNGTNGTLFKVIVPTNYSTFGNEHKVFLSAYYTLVDGVFTRIGLLRKFNNLKKNDLSKFDTMALNAQNEKNSLTM